MKSEIIRWLVSLAGIIITGYGIHIASVRRNAKNEQRITALEKEHSEIKEDMDTLKAIHQKEFDEIKTLLKEYGNRNSEAHKVLFDNDQNVLKGLSVIQGWIKGKFNEEMGR